MSEALLEETPAVALAIYAHPDDPAISCGGTLACWAAGGSTVHVEPRSPLRRIVPLCPTA